MIYKRILRIGNHDTVSPQEFPTVFVTAHINSGCTVTAGITNARNKTSQLQVGEMMWHCGFEFRLLSFYKNDTDWLTAKISVVRIDYDQLDSMFGLRSAAHSFDFRMPERMFGRRIPDRVLGFRVPGKRHSLPFNENDIGSMHKSLSLIEKNITGKFGGEDPSLVEKIQHQFSLLRSVLFSVTKKAWYSMLFGAISKLAIVFGIEIAELCGVAFAGVTQHYFAL